MSETATVSSEEVFANNAIAKLPPLRIHKGVWHAYKEGVWAPTKREDYFAVVRGVIPESARTARKVDSVLANIAQRFNTHLDEMRGFYAWQGDAIVLNMANGLLTVRAEGEPVLGAHTPEFMFTLKSTTEWKPEVSSEPFDRVIAQVLPDPADQTTLDDWLGYLLMPDCRYERSMTFYGKSGRGKSTIAEAVQAALGPGIVTNSPMSLLCESKSYYLPFIRHAAVNISIELSAKTIEDSATWKALVSGEITAPRHIREAPEWMRTACKQWCMSNNIPRFKNGTDAEVRRIMFLNFCQTFTRDESVKRHIIDNPCAVFNRMVRGLQGLMRRGGFSSGGKSSLEVHTRFSQGNDPIGMFVDTRCTLDKGVKIRKSILGEAFNEFCDDTDQPEWVKTTFFRRLKDTYPELGRERPAEGGERVRYITGIDLRPE